MIENLLQRLNPVTRRRLRRFREHKRAWYSFIILLTAYVLSLGANFIANDRPLYLRHEGQSYFPVLFFYPDDAFTGNGRMTRPEYKRLAESPAFADNDGNFMVWPPIPYGPYEIIRPETIELPEEVRLLLTPQPARARLNIGPDYRVERATEAEAFFPVGEAAEGTPLDAFYEFPKELRQAIAARFENQAAERMQQRIAPKIEGLPTVEISLSTYRPRGSPPDSVRLRLEEIPQGEASRELLLFEPEAGTPARGEAFWEGLGETEQESLLALAARRFEQPLPPQTIELGGRNYDVRAEKEDVAYPFRPVRGHWLGIDDAGRDVLSRIIYGFRISMSFGLLLVAFSMALGIAAGAVQGYFGGLLDITGQRFIEIWSALPFLYIMILVGSIFGRSFLLLLLVYGIFNWIGISYYMRAEFLKLRRQQFVEAARCLGVPTWKILFGHIFPNALVPVVTFFPFSLVGAIGSLAALDYLGFGMPPPTASWGEMLNQAQVYRWAWWLITYPSLALFVVILLGVFVGEGVRNAFDPRDYSGVA